MEKRYIFGDVHGDYGKLTKLINKIANDFHPEKDKLIFLGDYVSHGNESFLVIDFLIKLAKQVKTEFLMGDHDKAFLEYSKDHRKSDYIEKMDGKTTADSYMRKLSTSQIPKDHIQFFDSLKLTYEEDDFFCVHAGMNPNKSNIREQKLEDLLTIGESFYNSSRVWKKLVIFGHCNLGELKNEGNFPYFDKSRNLLGLDTGCGRGGRLSCFEVRTLKFYQA